SRLPTSTLFPYTTLFRSNPSCFFCSQITQRSPTFSLLESPISPTSVQIVCTILGQYIHQNHNLIEQCFNKVVYDTLCKIAKDVRSEEHTSELQSRENLVC